MTAAADNTDLDYIENKFKYEFSNPHGEREFNKLNIQNQEKVLEKLEEFSKDTWKELVKKDRQKGLTPEKKHSNDKILGRCMDEHSVEKVYPFHFRVSKVFRVFGYQYKDTFYVNLIDPKHKEHK